MVCDFDPKSWHWETEGGCLSPGPSSACLSMLQPQCRRHRGSFTHSLQTRYPPKSKYLNIFHALCKCHASSGAFTHGYGVSCLQRQFSLPKSTWPIHNPSHNPLADLQEWQSLLHIKALLTSLKLFCQSISSHHTPVSSLALFWRILLHGLSFFHALSYFPDPSSFLDILFFIFLIPWSLHRTVGPPAYHTYLSTGKKNLTTFTPTLSFGC